MRVGLPRFRFRLWWLMVAVAATGVVAGGLVMWSRSRQFRAQGESHAASRSLYDVALLRGTFVPAGPGRPARYRIKPDGPDLTGDQARAWADYHKEQEEKYGRAARFPWLQVEPDPPMPAFALD